MNQLRGLNLYAGLGGNRKHWTNVKITAVEWDKNIAQVYSDNFPEDEMIIGDAHQYLLEHANEYDFVWTSPPCQSHSRMIRSGRNRKPRFVDMKLYEEILFLTYDYKGLWVAENVIPFYPPMMAAKKLGRHLFWSNFPEFF